MSGSACRTADERKLALDEVPTLLDATHVPAIVPGAFAPRLRLFYRPSLTSRHLRWVVSWEEWTERARELGLTAAVNSRGFARVAWVDRDAWDRSRDAVAFLKRRRAEGFA